MGEVDRRGPVGGGGVVDLQFVVWGERVDDRRLECAGIPLVAVGAGDAELDGGDGAGRGLCLPDQAAQPARTAVEMMRRDVPRELVGVAVEGEAAAGDAERHPAHRGPEIRILGRVLVGSELVEPQHHVGHPAMPVGRPEVGHGRAVGDQPDGHAALVAERVAVDRCSVGGSAETILLEGRWGHGSAFSGREGDRDDPPREEEGSDVWGSHGQLRCGDAVREGLCLCPCRGLCLCRCGSGCSSSSRRPGTWGRGRESATTGRSASWLRD